MKRQLIPDEIRVLNIMGAEYFIEWERVTRGASFFLPTTATPKQAGVALKTAAAYFGYHFETRARREYGRYGVRVWRTY